MSSWLPPLLLLLLLPRRAGWFSGLLISRCVAVSDRSDGLCRSLQKLPIATLVVVLCVRPALAWFSCTRGFDLLYSYNSSRCSLRSHLESLAGRLAVEPSPG